MIDLNSLLLEKFNVSSTDLEKAISYQKKYGGRVEQILVNMGALSDDKLLLVYSKYLGIPLLTLDDTEGAKIDSNLSDEECLFLQQKNWIALETKKGEFALVSSFPLELEVNQLLEEKKLSSRFFLAADSDIQSLYIKLGFQQKEDNVELSDLSGDEEERLRELASEAPTVNLLNSLISRAIRDGASDMHLEPFEGKYRVRYRVDGVLHEVEQLNSRMQLPMVTRLKILSGMDIAEKRRPQDGKIEMRIANQEIDIRVSALPLNGGESVVMRFLRKESVRYDMSVLELSDDIRTLVEQDLKNTSGVVLLTGPTGSGKTTSLYTFLNALNDDEVKIITLEDPVEYQLEGVNQVQINSEIGFTFANGLRSIVRQDPDIIMLGEIRDQETAQIALQSALTGHLVFSTVHTNDAPSAYTRLLDLGIEEFLLNAALVSIVAQRLARKVCSCSVEHPDKDELIDKYELDKLAALYGIESLNLVKAMGCDSCNNTGYKGRTAIIEYLGCDDFIKSVPKDENFIPKAKSHNKSMNRRTLLEDGFYKAIMGITTIEEAVRVAG